MSVSYIEEEVMYVLYYLIYISEEPKKGGSFMYPYLFVYMYNYSYDMYVRSTIQYSTTLVLDYVAVRQSIMYSV